MIPSNDRSTDKTAPAERASDADWPERGPLSVLTFDEYARLRTDAESVD
jgi:hypothetical protein